MPRRALQKQRLTFRVSDEDVVGQEARPLIPGAGSIDPIALPAGAELPPVSAISCRNLLRTLLDAISDQGKDSGDLQIPLPARHTRGSASLMKRDRYS
jgi:hypothetical protein